VSFIRCGDHQHWGRYGAAGLLLVTEDRARVLLQLRSPHVLSPNTWALPGGALERGEDAETAALREAAEETGLSGLTPLRTIQGLVHPRWSYTYVLATTTVTDLPVHSSWEASDHQWFDLDTPPRLQANLAHDWQRLRDELASGS